MSENIAEEFNPDHEYGQCYSSDALNASEVNFIKSLAKESVPEEHFLKVQIRYFEPTSPSGVPSRRLCWKYSKDHVTENGVVKVNEPWNTK